MIKKYRVKKNEEISKIISLKNSKGNAYFVIYKNEDYSNEHFRYAVSVSKKYGNAVERNKIKRRVRAIIDSQNIKPQFNLIIIIRPTVKNLSFEEIQKAVIEILKRTKVLEVK